MWQYVDTYAAQLPTKTLPWYSAAAASALRTAANTVTHHARYKVCQPSSSMIRFAQSTKPK